MSELYSIEKQTLTDIADALRNRYGETEMVTIEAPVIVFDDTKHYTAGFTSGTYKSFTISGATTIYVIVTYQTSGEDACMQFVSGNVTEIPEGTEKIYGGEYEQRLTKYLVFENTDTITTYKKKSSSSDGYGFYVTIIGFDAGGNPVGDGEIKEVDIEIKRTYKSSEMAKSINDLGPILPEEALHYSGNCVQALAGQGFKWFWDSDFINQITTEDIYNANKMFYYAIEATKIPFAINFNEDYYLGMDAGSMFNYCDKLEEIGPIVNFDPRDVSYMFSNCRMLRYLPQLINPKRAYFDTYTGNKGNTLFSGCNSLRQVPMDYVNIFDNVSYGTGTTGLYYNTFNSCYALDEVVVPFAKNLSNSNLFSNTFANLSRATNVVFTTQNDGTPYTASWKSQTIDLSNCVGYVSSVNSILYYNSGITEDKHVTNDTTYQALKNDPDWYTGLCVYSRYNHDSAVATINSLPDTSAYLASNGGSNTIKFRGDCGSATDGGAISTLTEEEIAVATVKGWTVTLT